MSNIDSVFYVDSERNKEKLHGELSSRAVFALLSYMDIYPAVMLCALKWRYAARRGLRRQALTTAGDGSSRPSAAAQRDRRWFPDHAR